MNPKLLLGLVLVLSPGFFCCCNLPGADESTATSSLSAQPAGQIYHDAKYGFQLILPQGWEARETSLSVSHYDYVFLTINNQRSGLAFEGWEGTWICNNRITQLQPDEVYISVGYAGGPMGVTMRADTVGEDLRPFMATNQVRVFSSKGLLSYGVSFFKRGQHWSIWACMKEPVTKEIRQKVMALLQSVRFVGAPVGNASWAESLAWKELPEKIRDPGNWWWGWPAAGQEGGHSGSGMFGQRSVLVTNLGSAYSVKFGLQAIGEWKFMVKTNGEVESEPPIVHVASPPPSLWPSDLPDASKGTIDVNWIAPYVQASKAFGKATITWFTKDGHVERQVSVSDVNPTSGFMEIIGHPNVMVGINEDWRITPRKVVLPPGTLDECYAESTPDSRVLVYQYNLKPRMVGMDIYIHGKRVNTVGPFSLLYPSPEVVLNDDGSAALLIAKANVQFNPNAPGKDDNTLRDELSAIHRLGAQIVALNTNGEVRFRTDCESAVWSPIVAPNGAGVLLRPNTGTNQNTFIWFTEKGELHSMDISPNPQCIGWIPQTCQSLFLTQIGFETTHVELIDWSAGKRLWDIPLPGGGEILAIGLTPKLIIFSVAELYPSGIWHKENESLLQSGKEWVRTFYAVDVQDGKLVARWRGQFPHSYYGKIPDHFLTLGDKLYYVTADEFTELNQKDIIAGANGWK
ncbi:MAG TPA: hypothetical protein VJT54_09435 [Verrucomicrobiae bacterium]|nr:hypothetical protein [Verrucomicrobiae bacterium]